MSGWTGHRPRMTQTPLRRPALPMATLCSARRGGRTRMALRPRDFKSGRSVVESYWTPMVSIGCVLTIVADNWQFSPEMSHQCPAV
jgi:hypothetical protein